MDIRLFSTSGCSIVTSIRFADMKTTLAAALIVLLAGCSSSFFSRQEIDCPEADKIQLQIDAISDSENITTETDLKNIVGNSGRLASLREELELAKKECWKTHGIEEDEVETDENQSDDG